MPPISSFEFNQAPESAKSTHANAVNELRRELLDNSLFTPAIPDSIQQEMRTLSTGELIGHYPNQFTATRDTNAEEAWRMGWTGKGVKLAVLDSHDLIEEISFPISPFDPSLSIPTSHGLTVSLIAKQVAPEADYELVSIDNPEDSVRDTWMADIFTAIGGLVANDWHIVNISAGFGRIEDGRRMSPQTWQRHIDNLQSTDSFLPLARPSNQPGALDPKALVIFLGTNLGVPISEGEDDCRLGLEECELGPASVHDLRKDPGMQNAGDRIIFVGALHQGTNEIADYSTPAGELKYDTLVADERFFRLDDEFAEGSSYAAPRVAGVAALVRQKFPNLSGAELKQVLLQTATDLGDPGPDEIFGYGKINLLGALSPLGEMTR